MRIIQTDSPAEAKKIMHDMAVDRYGIEIMAPKAVNRLIRIQALPSVVANILKQEMLSFGGDAAVARGALTGKARKTDCLLMGNIAQLNRLHEKLHKQPFGLDKLGDELTEALANYELCRFTLRAGKYTLDLGDRTRVMGIMNLTPDSFSGDGVYRDTGHGSRVSGHGSRVTVERIVGLAEKMGRDGADIIDIGGESSRPGARPVPEKEELKRVIPVVKALAKKMRLPISVDTCKPEVARQALDNGASLINDISALRSPGMAKVIARSKAAVVLMHMKGRPRTMQENPVYASLIGEIMAFLEKATQRALDAGITHDRIIIDPGIGFGKTLQHNTEILKRLRELRVLGQPILVGPSRKSFLGRILRAKPLERLIGTAAACVLAVNNGAHMVRVHDVQEIRQALDVCNFVHAAP